MQQIWLRSLGQEGPLEKGRSAAASAAKSLQPCLTLWDPIDGSPPGSPIPGILQARTLEWVAISFSNAWKWKVKVKSLSCVRFLVTPWTAAYQAPLPMGFSRQEYWSGVPLPSPAHSSDSLFWKFLLVGRFCSFIITQCHSRLKAPLSSLTCRFPVTLGSSLFPLTEKRLWMCLLGKYNRPYLEVKNLTSTCIPLPRTQSWGHSNCKEFWKR